MCLKRLLRLIGLAVKVLQYAVGYSYVHTITLPYKEY